jgi:HSP20 family protein
MANRDFKPLDIFFQMESDFLRGIEATTRSLRFQPCADMYETAKALIVRIELPGVRPENLNITLSADDRVLAIAGERAETRQEPNERVRYHHLEIFYGAFEREITLPANIRFDRDQISANYKDGFLVITLPKRAVETQQRRSIEVTRE